MKKITALVIGIILFVQAYAQEFNSIPRAWKWLSNKEAIFTFDGTYADSLAFKVDVEKVGRRIPAKAPNRYITFPIEPEGAVNLTYSPDSTKIAYTKNNDLYVTDLASGEEIRLTNDGNELILNGYSSWVYYEEILGRHTNFKAFWWSPDGKKIGFYRFDNSKVPFFPIYSPFGQDGSIIRTRYPKAGEPNPEVRIGIAHLDRKISEKGEHIVWADFNEKEDQYFGIPFWGKDSRDFYIARMPRIQNTLDLYAVNAENGKRKSIYHETYKTWLNWIDEVIFTEKGLYMTREFETDWQQIYFLSYDGKDFRRLTDGNNWSISLVRVDEKENRIFFLAKRDFTTKRTLYMLDSEGGITELTNPVYNAERVSFSPDGKSYIASYSNTQTPTRIAAFTLSKVLAAAQKVKSSPAERNVRHFNNVLEGRIIADLKGPEYDASAYALGQPISMTTKDGFTLPGIVVYPKGFDPAKKYPVHVDIYGGPDTPVVRDRWIHPTADSQWWSENGIIQMWVDCRAAGHNGRKGLDCIYKQLCICETADFAEWGEYIQSLPYVKADKIGVEGFSFGGSMTTMLLFLHSDIFHYGIAGGGVYDWMLYDTHYTERFMETPQTNAEGYLKSAVLRYASSYPAEYGAEYEGTEPVMLKITHGSADDNVHFQSTLQLIDELQKLNKKFDFMVYPDGKHGYRGYQGVHFNNANHDFWLKYLK